MDWLDDIAPLPHRVRLHEGESMRSFSMRLAARNGSTVKDVLSDLRRCHPEVKKRGRLTRADEAEVWRALGGLGPRAFTHAVEVYGNAVIERTLCLRCTHGDETSGRTPGRGWVCVKHKRWTRREQIGVDETPELFAAERHFRRVLAPRGILVDSPLMLLAEECALVGIARSVTTRRQALLEHVRDRGALVYPETVALARLFVRLDFVDTACEPTLPQSLRRETVRREVSRILPDADDAENWRAVNRVIDMTDDIARAFRQSDLRRSAPEAGRWGLLGTPGFEYDPAFAH